MTHDEAIKKAREALESVLMEYPNNRPGMDYDGPLPVFAKKCLIALAALGSLAEEPSEDVYPTTRDTARAIGQIYQMMTMRNGKVLNPEDEATAILTMRQEARDERTRRECADKYNSLFRWLLGEEGDFPASEPGHRYTWRKELSGRLAAIMGEAKE